MSNIRLAAFIFAYIILASIFSYPLLAQPRILATPSYNFGTNDSAFLIVSPPDSSYWHLQTSGTTARFYAVKAVNADVVWAAGNSGTVIRTTNAGNLWTSVGGGAIGTADIYAMDAVGRDTAFVTTTPSSTTFIYRTTNGGTNWSQVFSQAGGFISAIRMINYMYGIASGDAVARRITFLCTTDGGATWTRSPTEPIPVGTEAIWSNSLFTLGLTHIWFGTNTGKIYRTTDGGATWSYTSVQSPNIYVLRFNSLSLGIAISDLSMFRSTDAGITWRALAAVPPSCGIALLAGLPNTSEFWRLCSTEIFYSPDSGNTWTSNSPHGYRTSSLVAISMTGTPTSAHGWAVGTLGRVVHYRRVLTDVRLPHTNALERFSLEQNYPNPFNPSTTINYQLPTNSHVTLKVFDLLGREVATLVNEMKAAGEHEVPWNASDIPSGVYFYRLQTSNASATRKLLVLR